MRSIDRVHTCGLERGDGKRAVGLRLTFEDGQVRGLALDLKLLLAGVEDWVLGPRSSRSPS
jgi:hypothetical protein